jgi:flagellar hook-basal body complex protein FliE
MSGLFSAMDVSASALTAQRRRLELLVTNLANAQSTQTPEGGPYRRKDVVFESQSAEPFWKVLSEVEGEELEGVRIKEVITDLIIQRSSPFQQLQEFQSKLQKKEPEAGSANFKDVLKDALQEVDQAHKVSDQQIQKVISGEIQDVHTAMIAMQKADLSFQMMMQVRNKLIEAYHEVMRMQV